MPQALRIYHCDDSTAFTRLVRHWLDEHEGLEHVGECHSCNDTLGGLVAARPDVVLLDTMGSPGDTSLLMRIRDALPDARIVVYSGYVGMLGADALGGGADAYLEKDDDEDALIETIRAVAARP